MIGQKSNDMTHPIREWLILHFRVFWAKKAIKRLSLRKKTTIIFVANFFGWKKNSPKIGGEKYGTGLKKRKMGFQANFHNWIF